ncbi:hypothetical protein CDAR_34621 [Caerostris darwini]|uniref:Uncharacterized protein n=1 Tax=Caerostris darwini TaxID=1538125 RepID=A0AAV4QH51_9ARAC|nr:hypothetical protein CDAR_34621 [Caerostris darwini]
MRMWHMGEMPSAISASCHKHGKPRRLGGVVRTLLVKKKTSLEKRNSKVFLFSFCSRDKTRRRVSGCEMRRRRRNTRHVIVSFVTFLSFFKPQVTTGSS